MGFKIYGYDINREVSLMAISKINDCFELLAMVTYADRLFLIFLNLIKIILKRILFGKNFTNIFYI